MGELEKLCGVLQQESIAAAQAAEQELGGRDAALNILTAECDGLKAQLEAVSHDSDGSKAELDALNAKLANCQAELEVTLNERNGLQTELDKAVVDSSSMSDGLKAELDALKGELAAALDERNGQQAQLNAAMSENEGLQEALDAVKATLVDTVGEMSAQSTALDNLRSELHVAAAERDQALDETDALTAKLTTRNEIQNERDAALDEMNRLQAELDDLRAELSALAHEKAEAVRRMDELEKLCGVLKQESIAAAQAAEQELEKQTREHASERIGINQEVLAALDARNELQAQLDALNTKLANCQAELEATLNERNGLQTELDKAVVDSSSMSDGLKAELDALNAQRRAELAGCTAQLEAALDERNGLQAQLDALRASSHDQEGACNRLEAELAALTAELDATASERDRLKGELESVTSRLDAALGECDELKASVDAAVALEAELERLKALVLSVESAKSEGEREKEEAVRRMGELEKLCGVLQQESIAAAKAVEQELDRQRREHASERIGLHQELEDRVEEMRVLNGELAAALDARNGLQAQLDALQAELALAAGSNECAELQAELDATASERDRLKGEHDGFNAELEALKAEMDQAKATLKQQVGSLQAQLQSAESAKSEGEREKEQLAQGKAEAVRRMDELEKLCGVLQQESIAAAQAAEQEMEKQKREWERTVSEITSERDGLRENIVSLSESEIKERAALEELKRLEEEEREATGATLSKINSGKQVTPIAVSTEPSDSLSPPKSRLEPVSPERQAADEIKAAARERAKLAQETAASSKQSDAEEALCRREKLLQEVHRAFDWDQSGHIEAPELLLLGRMRRKLGHKQGEWTQEMNDRLVAKMDSGGDGKIEEGEFVAHFDKTLPSDMIEFETIVAQFMEVARQFASEQEQQATSESTPASAPAETEQEKQIFTAPNLRVDRDKAVWSAMRESAGNAKEDLLAARIERLGWEDNQSANNRSGWVGDRRSDRRKQLLQEVHRAFDCDQSGHIEAPELLLLGKMRRKLGHKQGEWTQEMNDRLVAKMDSGGDGKIEEGEFVAHFDKTLPSDMIEFETIVAQFRQVARQFARGEEQRDAALPDSASSSPRSESNYGGIAKPDLSALRRKQRHPVSRSPRATSLMEARLNRHMQTVALTPEAPPAPRSPKSKSPKANPVDVYANRREKLLQEVHRAFDCDQSGHIEAPEMLLLGRMRRKLGHKQGEWTQEMNDRLVAKIDSGGDGKIEEGEFVAHFDKTLPSDMIEFETIVAQFMEVARQFARGKHSTRSESLKNETSDALETVTEIESPELEARLLEATQARLER